MTEMLAFMAAPFAACLVLVGIHAYFGIHVIERRVLFVDLAVAQFAALGAVVGFASGHPPGALGSTLYSMGFATLAAALFAVTRMRHEKLPQEAIIGITFVVASATAILVADKAPEGAEHIKETLAGSLLWVTWPTVVKDLVIYSAVGLFHWLARKRFMQITLDPEEAYRRGWWVRWWDFLFYLSFGVIITFSVEIGGILMVFSYLVIPACIAILLAHRMGARLILGWIIGFVGSALGLVASYQWDFPTGPAIVVVLGLMLMVTWFVDILGLNGRRRAAFEVAREP
ncbi:MAG TPA: iron chelate uptake ABC transporter family permease subunit [Candidatus Polarisedimenticolia bacterium]|nr:iron chelate uptake ABC transporter family permease subunit [Candidatus Polarisedimenticolia bacterium]